MDLILTSAGSYPRIGETPEAQRHRRAYAQRERGEISDVEWRAVEDEVAGQVVREADRRRARRGDRDKLAAMMTAVRAARAELS